MNRNSTTIFIESASNDPASPCITPVPWVNNAPDFTGITEPTLSVLVAVYEAGKDNIVVIADPVPIPPTPRQIDNRRLRLALLQLDLLDDIEAAIQSLERAAQIEWEYATEIQEDHLLVIAIKDQLGLDTDAIITLALSLV
jgi:hypothetical protein